MELTNKKYKLGFTLCIALMLVFSGVSILNNNHIEQGVYAEVTPIALTVGTGVENDPYQITSEGELLSVAGNLTAHYKLMNNITLTEAWTPIGNSSTGFEGVFDGNGYAIYNITITASSYGGLFAMTTHATISNLTLDTVSVTVGSAGNQGTYVATGCLVGYSAIGTTIQGCNINNATITGYGTDIGVIAGDFTDSKLINCTTSNININIDGNGVGGIVGVTYSNSTNEKNVWIENVCVESGSIQVTGDAGGIIGWEYQQTGMPTYIDKALNYATVTSTAGNAGGIIGSDGTSGDSANTTLEMRDCINFGTITGSVTAGGIIGAFNTVAILNGAYNVGSVSATTFGAIAGIGALATYSNIYYDNDIAVAVSNRANVGTAVALTDPTLNDLIVGVDELVTITGSGDVPLGSNISKTSLNGYSLIINNNEDTYTGYTIGFGAGTYTATTTIQEVPTVYNPNDTISITLKAADYEFVFTDTNKLSSTFHFVSIYENYTPTISYNDGVDTQIIDKSLYNDTITITNTNAVSSYAFTLGNLDTYSVAEFLVDGIAISGVENVYTVADANAGLTTIAINFTNETLGTISVIIVIQTPGVIADIFDTDLTVANDETHPWTLSFVDGFKTLNSNIQSIDSASTSVIATFSGQGILSFDYKTDTENYSDKLNIIIDGVTKLTISGSTNWTNYFIGMENDGTHTLEFNYQKDSSVNTGLDTVWIKDVLLNNDVLNITTHSSNVSYGTVTPSTTAVAGSTVNIVATPATNCIFVGWIDTVEGLVSDDSQLSFMITEDFDITALFVSLTGANTTVSPYDISPLINAVNTYSSSISVDWLIPTRQENVYVLAVSDVTVAFNGVAVEAIGGYYTFTLANIDTITFTDSSSRILTISVINPGIGSITQGYGTSTNPYIINNQVQLNNIPLRLDAYYSLSGNIELAGTWTPIGTSTTPFSGSFNGNGHTISNLTITSGNYVGLFGYISGATVCNLTLSNISVKGATAVAGLAGDAKASTVSNIIINGNIWGITAQIGGIFGQANSTTNASNCTVYGRIINSNTNGNTGGLSGKGGNYTNCIVYADIEGSMLVGGLTGGYGENSTFTNCFFAGSVHMRSNFVNNYPYFGIVNGYGAWNSYYLNNSGQRITVQYTTSQAVSAITIYNASLTPYGIDVTVPTINGGIYEFTKDATFKDTYASMGLLSETKENGVVSNYGGMTIRFTMADGTMKYIGTLDRTSTTFVSNFEINLDELTSYVDNFADMTVLTTHPSYTTTEYDGHIVSIWGIVKVDNANDFEHLTWIINGGIPTTIGSGENAKYFNMRSVATISIYLDADIDLTIERTTTISDNTIYLNRVGNISTGDLIYNFYGLGNSEMMPFRGNFYGNNHTLVVNMNLPETYLVGIINISSEMSGQVQVENLTIEGTIIGRDAVGIVAHFDGYSRSGTIKFTNVINKANITGYRQVGGIIGTSHSTTITIINCTNFGTITGTTYTRTDAYGTVENRTSSAVGGIVGETFPSSSSYKTTILFTGTNRNYGVVIGNYFYGTGTTNITYASDSVNILYYTLDVSKPNVTITVNEVEYTSDVNGLIFLPFENINTYAEIPDITYETPYSTSPTTISNGSNLNNEIKVVESIAINTETSTLAVNNSTDNWVVNGTVTFTDGTTENIVLNHTISAEDLASNKLVFSGVTFTNSTYTIPSSVTATLSRITADVEMYVTAYNLLDSTESNSSEFATRYEDSASKYNTLNTYYLTLSVADQTRWTDYIGNTIINNYSINASKLSLDAWASSLIKSVDMSTVTGLSYNYGTTSISKNITFTKYDDTTTTINFTFTLEKVQGELIGTGTTTAYNFLKGEKIVYTFDDSISLTIIPREITGLVVADKTATYNGNGITTTASATNIVAGDVVNFTLLYDGSATAINAGQYAVTISGITGDDAMYYTLPVAYTQGTLTINKLALIISNNSGTTSFDYSKDNVGVDVAVAINGESTYTLTTSDYTINYTGTGEYNSATKPINAGNYTVTVTTGDNFVISGASTINFSINAIEITGVTLITNEFIYDKTEHALTFSIGTINGVLEGDVVNVSTSTIRNTGGQAVSAINAGEYYVVIDTLSNSNYFISDNEISFSIVKADLAITIGNEEGIYGETIDLSQVTTTITYGTLYVGDELNIALSKSGTINVGDHDITATYNNTNYNVTFTNGTYTITTRDISFTFGEYDITYDATNQISKLVSPTINNKLENDTITFLVTQNDIAVTDATNAGTYRITLDTTQPILTNYNVTGTTYKDVTIKTTSLAINVTSEEINYGTTINQSTFDNTTIGLKGTDSLADLGTIEYSLTQNEESVAFSNTLAVGQYSINAELTSPTILASNYSITISGNVLTIQEKASYISVATARLTHIYNEHNAMFIPNMYSSDDVLLSAVFEYVYTDLQDNPITAPTNCGTYNVTITGNAGTNYEIATRTYQFSIVQNQISVVFSGLTHTYNNQSYTPSAIITAQSGLFGSEYTTVNYSQNDQPVFQMKNVGTYTIIIALKNTTNFTFATENTATYTITKEQLDITIGNAESVYNEPIDLSQVTTTITSGTLYSGDELNIALSKSGTDIVGTYDITATYNNDNYDVTFINGVYTISQYEIDLTYTGSDTLTYQDGIFDNLLSANLSAYTSDVVTSWYTNSSKQQINEIINTGNYYLRVSLVDTQNYKFKDTNETIIDTLITVSALSLSLNINITNRPYNGEIVEIDSILSNETELDPTLYSIIWKCEGVALDSAPIEPGDYTLEVIPTDSNNYAFTNNTTTFSIVPRTLTATFGNDAFNYTRAVQQITVTMGNNIATDDVSFIINYTGGEYINVGEYSVEITGLSGIDAHNYALPDILTHAFTISTASVTVTFGVTEFDYMARALTETDLDISFDSNFTILASDYELNALPTNICEDYEVILTSNNPYIEFVSNTTLIDINAVDITNITLTGATYTFDGTVKNLLVNTTTLNDGSTATVQYLNNNQTNQGIYSVTAIITGANYNTLELTETLTINTYELTISYNSENPYVYNQTSQGSEIEDITNAEIANLISTKYFGTNNDYDSDVAPTNAGSYKLVVYSSNNNNVTIVNDEFHFVIEPKFITITTLSNQSVTYDKQQHCYNFEYTGVLDGDSIELVVTYNGETDLPINAGQYAVVITSVGGEDGVNYALYSTQTNAILIIQPKSINLRAEAKSVTYGDSELDLTYVSDNLFSGDIFTGELDRETGNNVNNYAILQSTLSAGSNYTINYTSATYEILPRAIIIEVTGHSFAYTGNEITPAITIGNSAYSDTNIARVDYIGDRNNAGTFTARVSILNSNYTLPYGYEDITFTITPIDATSSILSLASSSANYTGTAITPIALINDIDDNELSYNLTYKIGSQVINEIINAGQYTVTVTIDETNYSGYRNFLFTVNKIAPTVAEVTISDFQIYSNKIIAPTLDNALYKIGSGEWISNNEFTNLNELTLYTISIKIAETANYTMLELGQFQITTTISPATVNAYFSDITEFDISIINNIKSANTILEQVSEYELSLVNTTLLNSLNSEYEQYLLTLSSEVITATEISEISLGGLKLAFYIANIFILLGLMIVIRFRLS